MAKGPNRGHPLTAAGLRRVFRYHREVSGVAAGHPHALRHTFGTALAEAGVDLAVLQALMGHDHVESSAAYIHLAPAHVRAAYDAARQRQRAAQAEAADAAGQDPGPAAGRPCLRGIPDLARCPGRGNHTSTAGHAASWPVTPTRRPGRACHWSRGCGQPRRTCSRC